MAVPEMLKLNEITTILERIEITLAGNNKSTNSTRIGALRRISEAVKFINGLLITPTDINADNALNEIRRILLGGD